VPDRPHVRAEHLEPSVSLSSPIRHGVIDKKLRFSLTLLCNCRNALKRPVPIGTPLVFHVPRGFCNDSERPRGVVSGPAHVFRFVSRRIFLGFSKNANPCALPLWFWFLHMCASGFIEW